MTPTTDLDEAQIREHIYQMLDHAGWAVQDKTRLNLHEYLVVAVREMDTSTGPADYMLFIDGKACVVIEAKREGNACCKKINCKVGKYRRRIHQSPPHRSAVPH